MHYMNDGERTACFLPSIFTHPVLTQCMFVCRPRINEQTQINLVDFLKLSNSTTVV